MSISLLPAYRHDTPASHKQSFDWYSHGPFKAFLVSFNGWIVIKSRNKKHQRLKGYSREEFTLGIRRLRHRLMTVPPFVHETKPCIMSRITSTAQWFTGTAWFATFPMKNHVDKVSAPLPVLVPIHFYFWMGINQSECKEDDFLLKCQWIVGHMWSMQLQMKSS